ncbi:winged helix-turn-helix transcriptional regulator [Bradyrhizobium diazoefficiens]|nr:MarR family winged helix-turn-helix transcriptional regulator [Bradyrhizobium diazoefficiens]MBR0852716.1 winged helix-turn-helix transcriptional regulator [Bradyrhizobium diazoefficiens]
MSGTAIVVVNNNLSRAAQWRYKDGGRYDVTAPRTSPRKRAGNGATRPNDADEIGLDALVGHAGYAVRRFQLWIFQDFIKTFAEVDIRPTQYSVLTVIGANPGLSQMAVAKRLGIERARLVHLLDGLEQRKLVKRIKSKADRRSHALHLTAQGETEITRFKRLAARHERNVENKIGKENRARLLQILAGFT